MTKTCRSHRGVVLYRPHGREGTVSMRTALTGLRHPCRIHKRIVVAPLSFPVMYGGGAIGCTNHRCIIFSSCWVFGGVIPFAPHMMYGVEPYRLNRTVVSFPQRTMGGISGITVVCIKTVPDGRIYKTCTPRWSYHRPVNPVPSPACTLTSVAAHPADRTRYVRLEVPPLSPNPPPLRVDVAPIPPSSRGPCGIEQHIESAGHGSRASSCVA